MKIRTKEKENSIEIAFVWCFFFCVLEQSNENWFACKEYILLRRRCSIENDFTFCVSFSLSKRKGRNENVDYLMLIVFHHPFSQYPLPFKCAFECFLPLVRHVLEIHRFFIDCCCCSILIRFRFGNLIACESNSTSFSMFSLLHSIEIKHKSLLAKLLLHTSFWRHKVHCRKSILKLGKWNSCDQSSRMQHTFNFHCQCQRPQVCWSLLRLDET